MSFSYCDVQNRSAIVCCRSTCKCVGGCSWETKVDLMAFTHAGRAAPGSACFVVLRSCVTGHSSVQAVLIFLTCRIHTGGCKEDRSRPVSPLAGYKDGGTNWRTAGSFWIRGEKQFYPRYGWALEEAAQGGLQRPPCRWSEHSWTVSGADFCSWHYLRGKVGPNGLQGSLPAATVLWFWAQLSWKHILVYLRVVRRVTLLELVTRKRGTENGPFFFFLFACSC